MADGRSLFSALRGLVIWRFTRFGDEWALNATRWLYVTNHAYRGDRRRGGGAASGR